MRGCASKVCDRSRSGSRTSGRPAFKAEARRAVPRGGRKSRFTAAPTMKPIIEPISGSGPRMRCFFPRLLERVRLFVAVVSVDGATWPAVLTYAMCQSRAVGRHTAFGVLCPTSSACFCKLRCGFRGSTRPCGYLNDYEHDIFVSYASSELNAWAKRLGNDIRASAATGLGLKRADEVDLWMDYIISGNQPLTAQVRDKVARSGLLLVLMSEPYLASSWCRDEVEWFVNVVRRERAGRPVFVVRVRPTDGATWPEVFKDDQDILRLATTSSETILWGCRRAIRAPKRLPTPKDYYNSLGRLATDMFTELKHLADPLAAERYEKSDNIW